MIVDTAKCSVCGQDIPGDARTLGLCPRCLMRSAIAGPTSSGSHRFDAPIPQEIRHAFPSLEIESLIGQGGMGAVYKARQKSLDRLVAVKIFPRGAFDDPSFAERFAAEARTLASLKHPNIVAAHDFGETEDYCYLVMELVEGKSLRDLITRGEAASAAGQIIPQLCSALAYAHERGIIHRDIKPENILVEGAGESLRVRIADFGLAKLIERQPGSFTLTAPQRLIGTPDYMAPEQRKSPAQVDHRADIYALGVVYYEILTGELPIGRFKPPSTSPRLSDLITRCLESDPAQRPRSINEFVAAHTRTSAKRSLPRMLAFAAAELAVVALIVWAVVSYIRSRPAPVHVAATQPATQTQPATRAAPIETFPRAYTPRPIGGGMNDYLERMHAAHGPNRIVTVYVDDLPGDVQSFVVDRLRELSLASQTFTSGSPASMTIHLAPVRDLDGLAKKIDFGKVAAVDPERRTIEVIADAKRLPAPLLPAIKDPADPQFYARNLADLSAWDKTRRSESLSRLKTASPKQLNTEIAAALRAMLADPSRDIRASAVEALANWDPRDGDVDVAELLADTDHWVRQAAFRALSQYKTARAAQAVVAALTNENRGEAAAALRKIGPAAEDAALSLLNHTDGFVRHDAVKVLGDIGTARSIRPLEAIASGEHGLPKAAAPGAIAAIKKRAAQK